MTIVDLLGKSLKDDAVVRILERYSVDVIYDFDRLRENTPDVYWASIKDAGVQLRFNENQVLVTAFCYIAPRSGFSPIAPEIIGVPSFDSYALAERFCQREGRSYKSSPGDFLKVLGTSYDVHYEFNNGSLCLVTLMLRSDDA